MEKKFDAVKMVRQIRDKIYEETKQMSDDEIVKYFNEKGREAEKHLREEAKKKN